MPPPTCPACAEDVRPGASVCPHCGASLKADALATIIPFKNPSALIGYYCAVFSLIPCLGLILGPIAFICGVLGLRYRAQHAGVSGAAHAWIGIILGGITTLANAAVIVLMLVARNR